MPDLQFHYDRGGIHLPDLALWLDPQQPRHQPERVFVSHAHSDHIARHQEILATPPTARFLGGRLGGRRVEHLLEFHRPVEFAQEGRRWRITALPAGHILGSAMAFVEAGGASLLYTGDFKLRAGLCAETCQPRHADTLIMETTFGRPEYVFPPAGDVVCGIVRFCREAIGNGESPVLLAYSLGKSQELLRGLRGADLPIRLHEQAHHLTRIYEQFGQEFPPYRKFSGTLEPGEVLIAPPGARLDAAMADPSRLRTAVVTGWALDPACSYRYGSNAAFPLSDHADFNELIEFVHQVNPRRVYTLHGFASEFAATLRDLGFDARALSEQEQLTLILPRDPARPDAARDSSQPAAASGGTLTEEPCRPLPDGPPADDSFRAFADLCEMIGSRQGTSDKICSLAPYLARVPTESTAMVADWFATTSTSHLPPRVPKLGWARIRDALCGVGALDPAVVRLIHVKHSDPGESTREVLSLRQYAGPGIPLADVEVFLRELSKAATPSATLQRLVGILAACTPLEGKFLARLLTGDLRIGLTESALEEAIATAFDVDPAAVRRAHRSLGDIGETVRLARRRRLEEATLIPFRPVRSRPVASRPPARRRSTAPYVASTAEVEGAIRELVAAPGGLWCQLHKAGGRVALYTDDLREITAHFPAVASAAHGLRGEVILDGELVGIRDGSPLSTRELLRRLQSTGQNDLFPEWQPAFHYFALDLRYQDGVSWIEADPGQRLRQLAGLEPLPPGIRRVIDNEE